MTRPELMPHQIDVLNRTEKFQNAAYYLDMGLGKTFIGAERMMRIGKKNNLVICPKSMKDEWIQHFRKYYSDRKLTLYDLTKKNQLDDFMMNITRRAKYTGMHIGVINYELVYRRQVLHQIRRFTLMLDESSMIQNDGAKRTKFILGFEPTSVILLSGTPTSGKYENLWSQCHLLGWALSRKAFDRDYINYRTIEVGGFPVKVVDADSPYRNVERLKSKMRAFGAVFMKTEEVIDLPEQTFKTIHVRASSDYNRFMKHSYLMMNDGTEFIGDTQLTKILYARELCGAYCKAKLKAFEDLILSTEERIIVFYNYNMELDAIRKICEKVGKSISEVNGHVKDLENYENEPNSVTLIQYQAGAMGLNLQKANIVIYFTPTDKSELFEQSKKRVHRIGQTRACFYYMLVCSDSIEIKMYRALEKRRDFTDDLFKE